MASTSARDVHPTSAGASAEEVQPLMAGSKAASSSQPQEEDPDIVQYASPFFFAEVGEGKISVQLMRIGNLKGRVSAKWKTVETRNAKAGEVFADAEGVVVFEDGEHHQNIEIEILERVTWTPTLEFVVLLEEPQGCELGIYLYTSRVQVISIGAFPTNKYMREVKKGKHAIAEIAPFALLAEFAKLLYNTQGVAWRTLVMILFDQLTNLYLYFKLHVTMYYTDVLFADKEDTSKVSFIPGLEMGLFVPNSRTDSAMVLGIVFVLPMVAIHVWEVAKMRIGLDGVLVGTMRSWLFRKYLNFDTPSRVTVSHCAIMNGMFQDAPDVTTAYMGILEIIFNITRVLILVSFAAANSIESIGVVICMPTLMMIWAFCRTSMYIRACRVEDEEQLLLVKFIDEASENYEVIAEYMQRPKVNDLFAEQLDRYDEAGGPKELMELNNSLFPQWLGPVFTGIYIAYTAPSVLDESVSVGSFLAMCDVINNIAMDFDVVYRLVMRINAMAPGLYSFTHMMNLGTVGIKAKKAAEARRKFMETEESKIRKNTMEKGTQAVDLIPIKLDNVSFRYIPSHPCLDEMNATVPQGSIVAIIGRGESAGRATILRLLGERRYPKGGNVLIPPHLRVLHVSYEIEMLESSVWENLVFGNPQTSKDRVDHILNRLNMNKVIELLQNSDAAHDKEDDSWQKQLTTSEAAKLHLARALIMNPEVLVLQRPLAHYSTFSNTTDVVLDLLGMHVANRGIGMPEEDIDRRRPRTLFFSVEEKDEATDFADIVFEVGDGRLTVSKGKGQGRAGTYDVKAMK